MARICSECGQPVRRKPAPGALKREADWRGSQCRGYDEPGPDCDGSHPHNRYPENWRPARMRDDANRA